MNNVMIEFTSSIKFLGVIIDDNLKFNIHINTINKKISKNIGVMYNLRQYVSKCFAIIAVIFRIGIRNEQSPTNFLKMSP